MGTRQTLISIKVSVRGRLKPINEVRHLGLFFIGHRPIARGKEFAKRTQTEIIAAPFQKRNLELRGGFLVQNPQGAGNVGLHQLALQIACRSRNNDGRIVLRGPENGWYEIRERLADTCARLNHQMFACIKGAGNRFQHRDLSWAFLIALERPERATRAKVPRGTFYIEERAVLVGR